MRKDKSIKINNNNNTTTNNRNATETEQKPKIKMKFPVCRMGPGNSRNPLQMGGGANQAGGGLAPFFWGVQNMHTYMYVYIYIYRERDVCVYIYIYMYIYMHNKESVILQRPKALNT